MTNTKDLAPRMQGKVIQLDYDFITSLTGECSYCLTDAEVQMILAITDFYGWSTRWFSASGTIDQQTILDLQGGLVEALMNGCCPDNSVLFQWTPNGHYQTSNDGGATWSDSPQDDPRNPQPFYPPYLPPDTVDDTCTYADSIVQLIKTGIVDTLVDGNTYSQVLGTIASVMTVLLGALAPTVLGALIVGIIGAVITGIVVLGIPAFQSAMATAVYDRLRCNIKNHIESDGSFTQAGVDAIYSQIGSDETGMAALFLQGFVAAAGRVGLTNAARSGAGSPSADCTCGAGCDDLPSWVTVGGGGTTGVITYQDTVDLYAIQTTVGGDGRFYIQIKSDADANGCTFSFIEITGNPFDQLFAWNLVGETRGTFLHSGAKTDIYGVEVNTIMLRTVDANALHLHV